MAHKAVRMAKQSLLVAFAWISIAAWGAQDVRFNRLSVNDGLSQGVVHAITQDDAGFIWFGTQQGLNRFDGFEFRTFVHDRDDPTSLPGNWILALLTDRQGRIWVGLDRGGLARYDAQRNEFIRYPFASGVRAIVESDDGIWIGTDGDGIARLDPQTDTWIRFRAETSELTTDRIKALHLDPFGSLWIGTDGGGLLRFDPVTGRFRLVDAIGAQARVRAIADDGHELWIATYENGLYGLDLDTGTIRHISTDTAAPLGMPSNSLRALFADPSGLMWIGHEADGLTRFADGATATYRNNPGDVASLVDDHVSAIYQDRGGVMWVGTQAGISYWNPKLNVFTTIARRDNADDQLSDNWVASFAEYDADTVWVGTLGGGINKVNVTSGAIEVIRQSATGLNDNRVLAIIEDSQGRVWAGTRASGLNRYDPATGAWRHYRHDPDDSASLAFDGVTSILEDSSGHIWVGTYLGGLNRYLPETDGFVRYRHAADDPTSLCMDRVLSIFEDRSRALWIGTHGGGLCRLQPESDSFERFENDAADPTSLSSDIAWIVTEDTAGNLWVGTAEEGVNVWAAADRATGEPRFRQFRMKDGLASNVVYGLLADSRGRVWMSGDSGITRAAVDPATDTLHDVRRFSAADGLAANEFNFAATLRGSSGRFYFGGTSGFTTFHPEQIVVNDHAPNVVITRFSKLNKEVPLTNDGNQITLGHRDNLITFEYAAMDFTAPRHNKYMHQLVGFDDTWVEDGNRHRATYTNLAPGSYTFRVRAANNDGVWSTSELIVPLRVLPAPWATAWAYTAYAIALLVIGLIVWRSWSNRLAQAREIDAVNQTLLEEISVRKAKELDLERARQKAQQYLDVVEVIILAVDASGRVTMVNQKGARVLGLSEHEIVGSNFCETFVPPAEQEQVRQGLTNVEQYAYSEYHLRTKSGADRLIAWHTIRLRGSEYPAGGGVLMSGADVTQMRSLETELRNAQKMEALGTLARGVAHDFNNILSAILGYAELTQVTLDANDPARSYQEKIGSSVTRAREIVQGILTFGRVTNVAPKPTDVTAVAREALQLVRPVLPASVILQDQLASNCSLVMADPSQLIQIVLNLCTNAVQSMSADGGVLRVRTEEANVNTELARSLVVLDPGLHIKLSVEDTGPGMDQYTQSRIFEPFYTTRPPGDGTGLGLSVVHGIVNQLRGAIRVESNLGEGTKFEIYIPCGTQARVAYVDDMKFDVNPSGHGETVLFVDDEQDVVATAEAGLRELGYSVMTASTGDQALDMLARTARIDVVVTDQTMRGLTGEQVAAEIKKTRPEVPVLLISGIDQPRVAHVDGFLSKPFTRSELAVAIRRVLESLPAEGTEKR